MGSKSRNKPRPGLRGLRAKLDADLRRELAQYKPTSLGTLVFDWNGCLASFGMFVKPPSVQSYSALTWNRPDIPLEYSWLDEYKKIDREWLLDEVYKVFRKIRDQGGFDHLQIHDKFRFSISLGVEEFSTDRMLPWSARDSGTAARKQMGRRPPTIKVAWERIKRWLRDHGGDQAVAHLPRPVRDVDLQRAENKLGRALPRQLCALWRVHNGGLSFGSWDLHSLSDAMLSYRQDVAIARDVAASDAKRAAEDEDFADDYDPDDDDFFDPDWFPMCSDGAGNSVCVDLTSGEVIEVCHDPYYRDTVARSVRAWLAARLAELEGGEYELDEVLG